MKRRALLTFIFFTVTVISVFSDVLIELSSALRMESPFILASGKENAEYYIQVNRANKGEPGGRIILSARHLNTNKPLVVWARVWWEGRGENRFNFNCGKGNNAEFSGSGFSTRWEWIKAENTIELLSDIRAFNIMYRNGGFCIDQILLSNDQQAVPEGRLRSKTRKNISVYFFDDFMRESDTNGKNLGEWEPVSGKWSQYMISNIQKGRKSSQPEKSANAFALKGENDEEGEGIILYGEKNWRNYRVSVSFKNNGTGNAGIVFNYQDEGNYYVFKVGCSSETHLVRVLNGNHTVLKKSAVSVFPDNYYSCSISTAHGKIRCIIDDTELFTVEDSALLCGRMGLYCQSTGYAVFDDVFATSAVVISEDFEDWEYGRWNKVKGEWWVKWPKGSAGLFASLGMIPVSLDKAGSAVLIGRGEGDSLIVIGEDDWINYRGSVKISEVLPGDSGGIIFNFKGTDSYWAYVGTVIRGRDHGKKSIKLSVVCVSDGKEEIRESAVLDYIPAAHVLEAHVENSGGSFYYDNQKILKVHARELKGGRFGLMTRSNKGIDFDDIVIDFEKSEEPESWGQAIPAFTEENSMRNWARESTDWVRAEGMLFKNIQDFYGDVGVEIKAHNLDKPHFLMIKNTLDDEDGYRFELVKTGDDTLRCEILKNKKRVMLKDVALHIKKEQWKEGITISLQKDGHYISGSVGKETVIEFRDSSPIEKGRRVAVGVPGVSKLGENVAIISQNLKNYYFARSPVDWHKGGGEWKISNRWKCDPRWSWYGGRSLDKSSLWCKRELSGDFTIDMFMSMQMDRRGNPHYFHPGNMNISVCADGENLGSGYSFIFGGDRGRATQIMRNGIVVAETTEVQFLPPSTRDAWQPMEGPGGLHRRWFHLTVVRRGNLFEYYLDNNLMLSFSDDKPLEGRQLGIWTYDNGIMVARVRVSAEHVSGRKSVFIEKQPLNEYKPEVKQYPFIIESNTHRLGTETMESRRRWIMANNRKEIKKKPFVAAVEVVDHKNRDTCLKVYNRMSGGKFSLQIFGGEAPIENLNKLRFDYLLQSSNTKIDLFISTNRGWFYIRFTGDKPPFRPGKKPFYPVKLDELDVIIDSEWHAADLDLYNCFRYFLDTSEFSGLTIKGIFFGYGSYGYTDAGVGGNFKGETYYLDSVRFENPGKETFIVKWENRDIKFDKFAFTVDADPHGTPAGEEGVSADSFEYSNLEDGIQFFHIQGIGKRGNRSLVQHYAFKVDRTPPVVKHVVLTHQYADIELFEEGSGIDWETLSIVAMNRTFNYDRTLFTVLSARNTVTFDLERAGIVLEEGKITFSVLSVKDRAENVMRKSFYTEKPFSFKDDTKAPYVDFVLPGYLAERKYHFEKQNEIWKTVSEATAIGILDRNVYYRGRSSMACISNAYGSSFGFYFPEKFNASETPFITFMYRVPYDVRINLSLATMEGRLNIGFTDRNRNERTIGKIQEVKEDMAWHKAEINIRDMFLRHNDTMKSLRVSGIYFEDIGWHAADTMTKFWIDDFYLHSVYDNSKGSMKVWVKADDISGIRYVGYRFAKLAGGSSSGTWSVAENPKKDATGYYPVNIPASLEGGYTIEVYAEDSAGNRSDPISFPILIDSTKPVIGSVSPFPEERTAASTISVSLRDTVAGIKRESIILKVNDKKYSLKNTELTYSEKGKTLMFDYSKRKGMNIFPDNKEVKVGVYAEDGIGHPVKNVWYWIMDYSKDAVSPPSPYVTRMPSLEYCETFESSQGQWRDRSGGRGGKVTVIDHSSARGKRCLRITNRSQKGTHDCFIRKKPFDGLELSRIAFDYKIPKEVSVDFLLLIDGKWHSIQFASARNSYKRIGRVPCIKDGKWHYAEFDLAAMLKKHFPNRAKITVRNFIMGEWDEKHRNKAGASYYIDNFALYPAKDHHSFRFAWKPVYDATGIRTYRYSFSQDKNSAPVIEYGDKVMIELQKPEKAGKWYFAVCAEDNNNNMSKPYVIGPIEVTAGDR